MNRWLLYTCFAYMCFTVGWVSGNLMERHRTKDIKQPCIKHIIMVECVKGKYPSLKEWEENCEVKK